MEGDCIMESRKKQPAVLVYCFIDNKYIWNIGDYLYILFPEEFKSKNDKKF